MSLVTSNFLFSDPYYSAPLTVFWGMTIRENSSQNVKHWAKLHPLSIAISVKKTPQNYQIFFVILPIPLNCHHQNKMISMYDQFAVILLIKSQNANNYILHSWNKSLTPICYVVIACTLTFAMDMYHKNGTLPGTLYDRTTLKLGSHLSCE